MWPHPLPPLLPHPRCEVHQEYRHMSLVGDSIGNNSDISGGEDGRLHIKGCHVHAEGGGTACTYAHLAAE